ncbi:hypothetical protein AWJ14_05445 [Hoeflea olei]|uniref:DUF2087 domain-containing protein n=2 Tax=Hoeflea olei TaxID=1480615 RepID=A0A1C1YZ15_9HYPH|nr:hypothetical protein AWJ14_05445 [Hoeflea olei]
MIPLVVEDVSPFARALARQIGSSSEPPSHLALMNMVSRAAGFRNFQHLRAARRAGERLANQPEAAPVDHLLVERTLHQFDSDGRLRQWPSRRTVQDLCLWALWAALPARKLMNEREVNTRLRAAHLFDDPAILRRTMVTLGMLTRNPDGTDYCRRELTPPAEARALIALIGKRWRSRDAASGTGAPA